MAPLAFAAIPGELGGCRSSFGQFGAAALFTLGLIANVAIWLPIALGFGLAAVVGFDTVRWNGTPVHGVRGLLAMMFIATIAAAIGTLLFVIGGKIAGLLGERLPGIRIAAPADRDSE